MRKLALAMLFVGAFALGHPAVSNAQLVLYDDFSSALIDPTKWYGTETTGGAGNPTTESFRAINSKSGQLELLLTQYGLDNSDSGDSPGFDHLRVTNPIPITTMQATVTVLSATAEACPTNTSGALVTARAEVAGDFFNDGSSTGTNDFTGDIFAGIHLAVDPTVPGNIIQALVTRCSNSACSSSSALVGSPVTFTAAWTANQPQTLTLTWDAANHQFVFSAQPSGGSVETHSIPYTVSDSKPAVAPTRALRLINYAANCNGSQKLASMQALFDTVMVNP